MINEGSEEKAKTGLSETHFPASTFFPSLLVSLTTQFSLVSHCPDLQSSMSTLTQMNSPACTTIIRAENFIC